MFPNTFLETSSAGEQAGELDTAGTPNDELSPLKWREVQYIHRKLKGQLISGSAARHDVKRSSKAV